MSGKLYTTLFILFLTTNVFSQSTFQRLIGGSQHERAQTVLNTFDNAYMVNAATGSYGAGGIDAMLIKIDGNGQILWSTAYGTVEYDNSEFTIEATDHNYLCVGRSEISLGGPTAAIIFKIDSAGNILWSKTYGGTNNDGFVYAIETNDNGFAVVGNSASLSTGSSDILFVRTDANGDTIFTRSYGTVENEAGVCVIQLPDNGFLIAGRQTTNSGTQADGILLRTDSLGNQLWSKLYGDTLYDELTSVSQSNDGGFIVTGSTVSYGFGGFDILLMKTDSSGIVTWSKVFGGPMSDAGYDLHITSDSGYIISGFTESLGYGNRSLGPDDSNIFLLKTDGQGVFQWMEVYGDGLQDEAYRSDIAADGGFLVGGFTTNYLLNDSSQMLIIKTDSVGLSGCHEESVIPGDSLVTVLFHDTLFAQLSGLPIGNFTLISGAINTNNDDACLFSGTAAVMNQESFLVYPNPFTNELILDLIEEKADVIIYDELGRIQLQYKNVHGKLKINTSGLEQGIYFVGYISDSHRQFVPVILAR